MKLKGFQNFLKSEKILNLPLTSINSVVDLNAGKKSKKYSHVKFKNCLTFFKICLDKRVHYSLFEFG